MRMEMLKLYHNPRCSKSRETLKLLTDRGVSFETILYLEDPLSASEIESLCKKLELSPEALVRKNEAEYKKLGSVNENEWSMVLADFPKLMQRPIVETDTKAAIGRPPEKVLDILPTI